MRHIHIRDDRDVARYAVDVLRVGKTRRPSLVGAMDAGKWVCLGKFGTVRKGHGWPGWILRVDSTRTVGKTWTVLVYCKEPDWDQIYVAVSTDPVPWDEWYLDGSCTTPDNAKLEVMDAKFLKGR